MLERFPDGVWLVDLAPLSDPVKVPQTAARAVGIPVDTGAQALEALLDYLRPRQMLPPKLLKYSGCFRTRSASASP